MRLRLTVLLIALVATAALAWLTLRSPDSPAPMPPSTPPTPSEDRVAPARQRHSASIRQRCIDAGVSYPARELFLRAFKREREVEAWARSDDGPLRLVAKWPVLAASGEPGPKRREGDRQVPEGCYRVVVFNPLSNFHLSLGLDYPNASDRMRSDRDAPGSDIYIHGGAVSIGCLALGDDAIEELYVLAEDTREKPLPVHLFPSRMAGPEWEKLRAQHPEHAGFWSELQPVYDSFERTRLVPDVSITADGRYGLRGPAVSP